MGGSLLTLAILAGLVVVHETGHVLGGPAIGTALGTVGLVSLVG